MQGIPEKLSKTLQVMQGGQETPAPDSAYQDVQKFLSSIQQMKTKEAENANISEQAKIATIKEALHILQSAGVNLADPSSLQSFMQSLGERSPELAQMAQEALDAIFSEEGAGEIQGEMPEVPPQM